MNFLKLSTNKIFIMIGFGYGFTALLLSLSIYIITGSIIVSIISLLVAIILSIWAFVLVAILQKQLSLFTNSICEIIDEMMNGNEIPQHFSDKETLFSVVINALQRLFNSMRSNKESLDKERLELQSLISDISHQVKTPTTNLKIAALTLKEENMSDEDEMLYLQSMIDQVNKLEFLMGSLVKSSRLETGVIMLERKFTLIYETLATALGSIFLKA
ncbi:MAG: sensor histidine kinase, partial [Clostridium sp.]